MDPPYEISDEEENMFLQNARPNSKRRSHQDDIYTQVDPKPKRSRKEMNLEQSIDIHDSFSEEHRNRLRARVQSDPRHNRKPRAPQRDQEEIETLRNCINGSK